MSHFASLPIWKLAATAALLAVAPFGETEAQVRYRLVVPEVLGDPIAQTREYGNAINENGETLLNRVASFALWKDGQTAEIVGGLESHPAWTFSRIVAASINSHRQVVGYKRFVFDSDTGQQERTLPFYWDPTAGLVDLGELGASNSMLEGGSILYAINEQGRALGARKGREPGQPSSIYAFTWSFEDGISPIRALSAFGGHSVTRAAAINAQGTLVGSYHRFDDGIHHYAERGFIKAKGEPEADLARYDPGFFSSTHTSARALNDSGNFVGERDQEAYFYDAAASRGHTIEHPLGSEEAVKAYALNQTDIVAGSAGQRDAKGNLGLAPFIWSKERGSIDLYAHIRSQLAALLPEGLDPRSVRIYPKAINRFGQISARLETTSTFAREVLLEPELQFIWHEMSAVTENGVPGILYRHLKAERDASLIAASALGYAIHFECSDDMRSWSRIDPKESALRMTETRAAIEIFLPFSECRFIRPALAHRST